MLQNSVIWLIVILVLLTIPKCCSKYLEVLTDTTVLVQSYSPERGRTRYSPHLVRVKLAVEKPQVPNTL